MKNKQRRFPILNIVEALECRWLFTRVLGIDVSSYQGAITKADWTTYKNSDSIVFAWTKGTEGIGSEDPDFTNNMSTAAQAGVPIGPYNFAHYDTHTGTNGAQAEADNFWTYISSYYTTANAAKKEYMMPMLDLEDVVYSGVSYSPSSYGYTQTTLSQWVNAWGNELVTDAATAGVTIQPVIYTGAAFAQTWLNSSVAQSWANWIADYNGQIAQSGSPLYQSSYAPWTTWQIWQYNDAGTAPGDQDVLNGDATDLQNFIFGSGKYATNSYVETTASVSATQNYNGSGTTHTIAKSTYGTVLTDPQYYNNAWFFDVQFTTGVTGWVKETSLAAATAGPNTPANISPADNGTVTVPTPTLTASAFADTSGTATQTAAEWQLYSGATLLYDTGTDTTDLTSLTLPNGKISPGNSYTWKVRYKDSSNIWSAYSTATAFSVPSAAPVSLAAASAYYLQDATVGSNQYLDVWNSTTNTGTPNQTIWLSEVTTIIVDGASTGSNITISFANGSPSPSNRLTIFAAGTASNNTLNIIGSASASDTVSFSGSQYNINATTVAFSNEGTTNFTPGTGTDSLSISGGTLNLQPPASGDFNLNSLTISSGATLNIGSDILNYTYTSTDPDSAVQSMITTAFNKGSWTGTGLTSSLAATNPDSSVGYFDTGSAIIIRATWAGDANCDGVLNADDLSVMALALAQKKTDWTAGNFNYDTQINVDDWTIFNYSVAYANGRNYSNVFAPGAVLESATQMSQLLSTPAS